MTAIYKRELKACFNSFIGWLFLAVMLFFTGLYVTANNLAQGSAYLTYALQSSLIIFIVAIPILTMRILAEERKNKTDQMILTAPVCVCTRCCLADTERSLTGRLMCRSSDFSSTARRRSRWVFSCRP